MVQTVRGTDIVFQPAFNALLIGRRAGLIFLNWSILRAGTAVVEKAGAELLLCCLPAFILGAFFGYLPGFCWHR